MGDILAKLSRSGYDAKTCADHELLFNSGFPLLKIHKTAPFSINNTSLDVDIVTHGLDYYPMFLVFVDRLYPVESAGKSRLSSPGNSQFLKVTTTKLRWTGATDSAGPGSINGRYYIFRHNLLEKFTAPIIKTSSTTKGSYNSYKIKLSKEGKSINSTDYRDFVIHSDCRSPIIHKMDNGNYTTGSPVTVNHNLGHEPMYFLYAKLPGSVGYQMVSTADDARVEATSVYMKFTLFGDDGQYAYVMLKDPILLN